MIDRPRLLADLQRLLKSLEGDLRERCDTNADVDAPVREQYERARSASRTAQTYEIWREDYMTQAAVAWILTSVFVRFLEDNRLADTPFLAGPGDRLALARDHHTVHISQHATETDREYLLSVFRGVAKLPAMGQLLDERHNPLFRLGLSADGARMLLEFWQKIDPGTGALVHDFTDPAWSTRFLGDLYQDLSESARKTYALLQTPEFVEEFILDRTLEPAIQEFGYQAVRLIDLACGSGHFLLGAFPRLFDRWRHDEPGTNPRALAQRALDSLSGVDLNPFAVAIARFRLLIAALQACDVRRLAEAPDFKINLAVGDSLLHGSRPGRGRQGELIDDPLRHVYETEDAEDLARILGQRYHAVVGNPPYITPKDAALSQAYRDRFGSCHRQYSLAVPFMERFFDLAVAPEPGAVSPAGFVGMITGNAFMKREFGKKLIEHFIPRWDLTHVVDTSGAYIPGHGTPTVILFARHRVPVASTVRAVLGIRGEPLTPEDPSKGLVWSAIVAQIDNPGSGSEFVSVADLPRERFHSHPWSIGGGGAADLKVRLEDAGHGVLGSIVEPPIGRGVRIAEEEAYMFDSALARRSRIGRESFRHFLVGEGVRDWTADSVTLVWYRYGETGEEDSCALRYLWPWRTTLANRSTFQGLMADAGLRWYDYMQHTASAYRTPLSIVFPFVATHNHFALDRGGRVFNRTAPVIKLPSGATEDDHLCLLGLLNSSTACFWMKQIFYDRGGGGIGGGLATEAWEKFFEHDGTKIQQFPVPRDCALELVRRLDAASRELSARQPDKLVATHSPTGTDLTGARRQVSDLRDQVIALQEELDWRCYGLYRLLDEDLCCTSEDIPRVSLGERAFEIVLARKMAAGEVETKWFERHGSTPITDIPAHWPEDYRRLVERRIEAIEANPGIALIEQPVYKRRWNSELWEEQEERAVRGWLLDRLEDGRYWPAPRLTSCARLTDRVREDAEFMQVAEVYRGRADFDVARLVTELVEGESVPFLPVLRYTPSGMQKRRAWEECWSLQRREDTGEAVDEIPVPPKYGSADFKKGAYRALRGKLDVPKERFVLYPHAERGTDPTPVLGWAGWHALQQAQAVAAYLIDMKELEGWPAERLAPLLAGLLELVPWLRQWHNDVDPATGLRMGDYFAQFLEGEARTLGLTVDDLRRWAPPAPNLGKKRKTAR